MTDAPEQSSGETERHRGPAPVPVKAVDDYRFLAWFREEWAERTRFGKFGLLVSVGFWSWMIVLIGISRRVEDNWPATYKE